MRKRKIVYAHYGPSADGNNMPLPPVDNALTATIESYKAASDTLHELITISSALIGATVTFQKDFFHPSRHGVSGVVGAFILFGISILASIWGLMAITGCIASECSDGVNHSSIRIPAVFAVVSFLTGMGAYIYAGIRALSEKPRKK